MPKTAVITVRIEPELKKEAEEVISQVGLTMSQAMTLHLRQIVYRRGIPFELKLPNQETLDAVKEAQQPENLPHTTIERLHSLSGIVSSGEQDTSERVEEIVAEAILQKHQPG